MLEEDVPVKTVDDSISDKTRVETGNNELNTLMNGNMFEEKPITNRWKNHSFKDNVVKNLHCSIEKGGYFPTSFTEVKYGNSVQVDWNDRHGDIKVGNTSLISKGINMDVYPKAIHEFYNYSVEAIYHIFEVAAGFIFDTYKKYISLRSMGDDEAWKQYLSKNVYENYINSFGKDYILPFTDIKSSKDDGSSNEVANKYYEFSQFIEKIRAYNKGESPYAKLNPDEYVNVISALRNEINTVSYGQETPIINLDIQNNNFDLSMLKTNNRFISDDVSVQIVPYILNILFDEKDSVKNGYPIVGYNVYIGFESVCDVIISAIRWNKGINDIDVKQEFITTVLSSEIVMKHKINEKIANAISLFLFANVHKVHDTFNSFLTLSEDYYDKLIKNDPEISNLILKVRYYLADTSKLNVDDLIKETIEECIKKWGSISIRPENMLYELNEIAQDSDNKQQLNRLIYLIFARAFSMINEDSITVNAWDDVFSTTVYDKNELITKINGVDDYFLKDFFSNLFTSINVRGLERKDFSYVNGNEKTGLNGELISKKYTRIIHHFYIMLGMTLNIYGNLMLSLRDIDINNYSDTKMFKALTKIKNYIDDSFASILKNSIKFLTSSYLNPVAVVDDKSLYSSKFDSYLARNSYLVVQLNSALDLFFKYIRPKIVINYDVVEKIDRLFDGFYKAEKVKLTPRNNPSFNSYNTPELLLKFRNVIYDKNEGTITVREPSLEDAESLIKTVQNNFVKSGLISLESSNMYL